MPEQATTIPPTTQPTAPSASGSGAPSSAAPAASSAPSTTGTGSSGGQATAPDWTSGFNDDLKGYVGTKGFKDPSMVVESYKNLEKLLGAPKDRLLKLPDQPDSPEWDAIYERLGTPKSGDEYKIDPIKDNPESVEFVDWAKNAFHGAKMTGKQAETVIAKWSEFVAARQAKADAVAQGLATQAEAEMKTKWGNAYEQNVNMAKAAAQRFGVDKATMAGIEKTLGTVKTFEFFHNLGKGLGEANFNRGEGGGAGFKDPVTAKAQLQTHKADKNFMSRYLKGDVEAVNIMNKLHQDAYPGEMSI